MVKRILALAIPLMMLASTALANKAREAHVKQIPDNTGILLNAIPLDCSTSCVFTLTEEKMRGFKYVVFYFNLSARTSSTDVVLTCTTGPEASDDDYELQVCTGTGTCVLNDAGVLSKAGLTTTKKWRGVMAIPGGSGLECTASSTGAAVTDILTLRGAVVTE